MQNQCYKMQEEKINSWVDLRENCPVDISRLIKYANSFNSRVGVKISTLNIVKAKRSLIEAKGYLDLMIVALNQLLYDRTILKNNTDIVLHGWLMENLGRLMKDIDEQEKELLIVYDGIKSEPDRVGVSRLSAYAKLLKLASQSVVFESLVKSTEEYNKLIEGQEILSEEKIIIKTERKDDKGIFLKDGKGNQLFDEKEETHKNVVKVNKNTRTFLYIFFHVLQITLFTLGSLARRKDSSPFSKKESMNSLPTSWKQLLSQDGQQKIAEAHKDETGIILPPELTNGVQHQEEEGEEEVIYDEESEEKEEEEDGENV